MDNQDYNYTPAPQVNAPTDTQVMVFGIIAIALCESGILGLIFSIIARKKAKAWTAAYGPFTGKAKVGNILSRIALPISIIMIVFWVIYGIVVGVAAGLAAAGQLSQYSSILL